MSAEQTGARQNRALEGLTLTPDGTSVWAAMEGPGYNDGELPTTGHGALTRVTRFDATTGAPRAQFAHPSIRQLRTAGRQRIIGPRRPGRRKLPGRRAWIRHPLVVRIYRATTTGADNILDRPSLTGAPPKAMSKTLIADLSKRPELSHLDNVEGITLGPKLSDGRQSVVLVTDDNFSAQQVTQFYAFAM